MAAILLGGIGSALGAGFGGSILGLSGAVIGGGIGSLIGTAIDSRIIASFAPTSGRKARGWTNCASPAPPKGR